ncbi:sugar phosphate isomerase/epimerase [Lachnospiraceae bacterium OttesenSCG-928-D06]|nr:sugar phosphate isomerase/epimerase [Lachnospiraceae bacterium OttesenSCG-928-D06]
MNYGIQLFSIRDLTEVNMENALQQVAKLGYHSVEFAGFFGNRSATIKEWLAKYNLQVSGTHTGLLEITEHFQETVAYHKEIGNKLIIIPGADLSDQMKLDHFIGMVNMYGPMLEEEGICLAYHNHDHEFKPNADGSIIYDQLLERTSLKLELDTYWAYVAGKDPVEMTTKLLPRLVALHIKDGLPDRSGKPLGMGTAPVKAVYETAVKLNLPLIVESETLTPDGITEARICIEYLRGLC